MNFILDIFFPKFCLGCQKEGSYLCEDCRGLLEISQFHYCLCNKHPSIIPLNRAQGKCPKCQNKKLSGLYSALPYQEGFLTKKLIHQFKYKPYLKDLATVLANILIEHFVITKINTNEFWQNSFLTPIPLSAQKFRERGYNQSEELAKELSKVLQIPVLSNVLIKTKNTGPQMELKKEAREKNLLGAFAINKIGRSDLPILNKKIFLVDDVYTTGSTMEECARVLRSAGAKSVWGITIAREG